MNKVDIHDLRTFTVTFIIFYKFQLKFKAEYEKRKSRLAKYAGHRKSPFKTRALKSKTKSITTKSVGRRKLSSSGAKVCITLQLKLQLPKDRFENCYPNIIYVYVIGIKLCLQWDMVGYLLLCVPISAPLSTLACAYNNQRVVWEWFPLDQAACMCKS